ncbi:FG-GAP-like repeat-containing protein [bacterium]|nr:FG-GAP-like repeat-containing protein [bacterium]
MSAMSYRCGVQRTSVSSALAVALVFIATSTYAPNSFAVDLLGPGLSRVPMGQRPQALVVADLDCNGTLDMATADRATRSIHVALGSGLGTFRVLSESFAVGADPWDIGSGDFNNDGQPDLVVANAANRNISVLYGDCTGRFDFDSLTIVVGATPSSLFVADVDLDGLDDVVVGNQGQDDVSILLGTPNGPVPSSVVPVGNRPIGVVVADLNGDTLPDIAVTNRGEDTVSILVGNGSGEFAETHRIPVGDQPTALVAIDLNRDGRMDLVTADRGCQEETADCRADDTVSLVLQGDVGKFLPAVALTVFDGPWDLATGDFDRDGLEDIAVANRRDDLVTILRGDGLGGLSLTSSIANDAHAVAVGDIDLDQINDLLMLDRRASAIVVGEGDGRGGVISEARHAVGDSPFDIDLCDFDADGLLDVVTVGSGENAITLLTGDGMGDFTDRFDFPVGTAPRGVVCHDLDGDGILDLAATNSGDDTVSALFGDGFGGLDDAIVIATGIEPVPLLGIELGDDGGTTLISGNVTSDSLTVIDVAASRQVTSRSIPIGNDPYALATADFDFDGHADVVVAIRGDNQVRILLGDRSGVLEEADTISVGDQPAGIAVGDFDQDGRLDLGVSNRNDDTVSILIGSGDGTFRVESSVAVGTGPRGIATGDLNGDGNLDLVSTNRGTDDISLLMGDGEGAFRRVVDLPAGDGPDMARVADLDGDQRQDLVIGNRFSDDLSLLFNQLPARADINGSNAVDGFDLAVLGRFLGVNWLDSRYDARIDVNLDGWIDATDLAIIAAQFGSVRDGISPLAPEVLQVAEPAPDTVGLLAGVAADGTIALDVVAGDSEHGSAGAQFGLDFAPSDGSDTQLLEWIGFKPGTYMTGTAGQAYEITQPRPGRLDVTVFRVPQIDETSDANEILVTLFFGSRREGTATLTFAPPAGQPESQLFTSSGTSVGGVRFEGAVTIEVLPRDLEPPSQQIGVDPRQIYFGHAVVGSVTQRAVRILNFGAAPLTIVSLNVNSTAFTIHTPAGFSVGPFGYVDLQVVFRPDAVKSFSGQLSIASDDPLRPEIVVPLEGTGTSSGQRTSRTATHRSKK